MPGIKDAPFIITLDGPAGVGKSSLAKRVAQALGVAYLDTGAMFRTVAMRLAQSGVLDAASEAEGASAAMESILQECAFSLEGAGADTRLLCNGSVVGDEIRTEEAGMMAARAGRIPSVRAILCTAQQRVGACFSLVAEGRDMGTVVFPGAVCKIFLDADVAVRAMRRLLQLREMGEAADLAELTEQIRLRDEQDRTRNIAPLRPADDAHIIDTSRLTLEEVFTAIMELIEAAGVTAICCAPPNKPLRRKDRALSHEESVALLNRGEYGVLALMEEGGWPCAVPLSYVLLDNGIYFHSARAGQKVDSLARCDKICFTVVGETEPVYDKDFSTYYESVMVFGRARLVEDAQERYRSLWALAEKYLPEHMDKADKDIRASFERTAVYRISLDLVTGKAKKRKTRT